MLQRDNIIAVFNSNFGKHISKKKKYPRKGASYFLRGKIKLSFGVAK